METSNGSKNIDRKKTKKKIVYSGSVGRLLTESNLVCNTQEIIIKVTTRKIEEK